MTFKKIKLKLKKKKKSKLIIKLVEEMTELQKELLKGRYQQTLQELGDVKALIEIFENVFNCKKQVKHFKTKSLKKWENIK